MYQEINGAIVKYPVTMYKATLHRDRIFLKGKIIHNSYFYLKVQNEGVVSITYSTKR